MTSNKGIVFNTASCREEDNAKKEPPDSGADGGTKESGMFIC